MKPHPKIIEMAKKLNRPEEEFLMRADGRCEWVCEHGIGHTAWYPEGSNDIHGCDGCCEKLIEKLIEKEKEGK